MRTILCSIVFAITFTFCSCSEIIDDGGVVGGMEWDVTPLNIQMYVRDRGGNDLLSASCANNIIKNNIYVLYHDSTYYLNAQITPDDNEAGFASDITLTKAYLAVLEGIEIIKYGNDYMLVFGEFDGAKDWNDSFEIYWGDGTSDIISFKRDFEWTSDGSPKVVSSAQYLNGKKMDNIIIIK